MEGFLSRFCLGALFLSSLANPANCQSVLTWQQVREKFEAANPALLAGKLNIDESRAGEITAYLRPNPQLTLTADGTQIAPDKSVWRPFAGTYESPGVSYLIERRHKRELRLESAQGATALAVSGQGNLDRTLLFDLRQAFVQTLQAKEVLRLARDNLSYWDQVLRISRDRFQAGDLAQIDLDRLELQRVQFESDLQTAEVNLRTGKIQLLMLLDDRTPVDQFDVVGPFDFGEPIPALDELRRIALDNRPDLRAAMEAIEKAKTDHKLAIANGSTDPTLSAWYTHNSSNNNPFGINTLGLSVGIPLRIFDRNQGEKLRTQLEIDRDQRLFDATQAQVFSDVDSSFAVLSSNLALLQPYKTKYLQQALRVRDTVRFAYEHGGASLLDFLSAENDYRGIRLNYANLIGSYLTAAAQLNMAVGREVIQ